MYNLGRPLPLPSIYDPVPVRFHFFLPSFLSRTKRQLIVLSYRFYRVRIKKENIEENGRAGFFFFLM